MLVKYEGDLVLNGSFLSILLCVKGNLIVVYLLTLMLVMYARVHHDMINVIVHIQYYGVEIGRFE